MSKATITLFFLLIMIETMAQSKSDFYGEWKVQTESEFSKEWSLKKPKKDSLNFRDWGKFVQFNEDGTYLEHASAPCGMDDNHYRYSGKWTYNPESKIIELKEIKSQNDRPGIYKNYKVLTSGSMKVLSYKKGQLEIQVVKHWEKITEK
jgi:hypothetical protein